MYNKRIKIFIFFCSLMLLICLLRLAQMQLMPNSSVQSEIEKLKNLGATSEQLKTIRGKILDTKGRVLAVDKPVFWLNIDYQLCMYWDICVRESMQLKASEEKLEDINMEIHSKVEEIKTIIEMCTHFGFEAPEIDQILQNINDGIWKIRNRCAWRAWKNDYPNQEFEEAVPDPNTRMLMAYDFRIPEMYDSYSLFELETDDDIFTAQFEFMAIEGIEIVAKGKRYYPYGSVAAQTIGFVSPATDSNNTEIFENDKLLRYHPDEVYGRDDGIEYVCEPILRGRRGEEYVDIDGRLISRTDKKEGHDVVLTIDIELQRRIENLLADDLKQDPNLGPGMAAVVIDVQTSEILTLASVPVHDLSLARDNYGKLNNDSERPLLNRAINAYYPPGSVVKPLILIAGMETGKITAEEPISCSAEGAPPGWPKCWINRSYSWMGHDNYWNNNARNAIKGSCNIYFSQLANMLDSNMLQSWLYNFGYGHKILAPPEITDEPELIRNFYQLSGMISSSIPKSSDLTLSQLPGIKSSDKKYFGIGQGNLAVTPLQAANSMAAIARGGTFASPVLFKDFQTTEYVPLNISQKTLETVYDGMSAVVNENNGTAYNEFVTSLPAFTQQNVKIFGKTGSTERPDHAWFAGFAQDNNNRKLAFAVVVENGQHGSSDAAPLARDILQFCIEEGHLGKSLF